MVSGKLPFEQSTGGHLSLMRMHAVVGSPDLTEVVPDAHPMLDLAVMRAMAKEPEQRPTAAQLGTMLRELLVDLRGSGRSRRASDLHRA